MSPAFVTGGRMCGGVRYTVAAPLGAAAYCHCSRCRRRSGTSASANAMIPRGALRIELGADLVREWHPPGNGWIKAFCGACGSALWSQDPQDADVRGLRLGTVDSDPGVTFTHRQFTDDAAPWEPIPDDGLPRYGGPAPG